MPEGLSSGRGDALGKGELRCFRAMRAGTLAVWPIWLMLGSLPAPALDPAARITQYFHSAWRVQDGIFEAAPNAVGQTADGYIWIGTSSGLVKYDGVRFAAWAPPPGKSLANPNVISLLGSSDGSLWIGTANGLLSWKNNDLREHVRYRINGIIEDHTGRIWAARARSRDLGGLCQIVGEKPGCIGGDERMKLPTAGALAEDAHGNLWVGGAASLLSWREGSFKRYLREELARGRNLTGVESIAAASDGSVWVSVPSVKSLGLVHIVEGRPKHAVLRGVKTQSFGSLLMDRAGSLWLGSSDDGLYRLSGGRVDHFGLADGLSSNTVSSLFEDREGNLWVATPKGLDFFRDRRVLTFSNTEGLVADQAGSILASHDGTVWVGNRGALEAIRNGVVTTIPIPGARITALLEDHAGRLWAGVDNMLTIYEHGQFRKVNRPDGSPVGITTALAEDREHNIWAVANPDQKLFRIRDQRLEEEFSAPRMPISRIVEAGPLGGIWLGFLNSFGHYVAGKLKVSPVQQAGIALLPEADGSVWTATRNGLVRWKDGRAETLTSKNGLPCDLIYSAIRDDHATLWLYTRCGLVGIADSELERWWRQPGTARVQTEVVDALDGATPYSSTFHPSAAKAPDGRLWFVNDSVVQVLDPNRPVKKGPPPAVYIEQVRADRREYGNRPVRLPPHTRDIEINYTALSYAIPQRVRFRYRLDGRDRGWQDAGTRREVFYNDLPPAEYRFRVSASNGDGVWNESGATLEFSIAPAYYQTNWFRALGAALALAFIGAAYQFRIWQVQRESRRLRDVIETIPAYVWSALPDGFVDFVNRRWLEFSGFSLDQAKGWGWADALHPEDRGRLVDAWRSAIASGKPMEEDARMRGANGEYRWLLFRSVPQRDGSGKIVKWYGKSMDITELKRAEEERERMHELEADLAHMNRVSMMGELAASVAHEVNQPLTGIVSNGSACLRFLAAEAPDLEEIREAVRDMVRDGKRAGEVIARIRGLAKRAAPPRERLDLNETIREVLALVGDEAKRKSVVIRTHFADDLFPVFGDRVQLQQVLLNLVMNAMDAMSSVEERERQLEISTENADPDQVQGTVKDTGTGMDPQTMARVFEAFYTTKPGGMGMGLSICRSIVQNHGGRLWATLNDGPGTSFHFTLPKDQREDKDARTAAV